MRYSVDDQPEAAELCSEIGARRLAQRIKDYWLARGYRGITTGIVKMELPRQKRRNGEDTAIFGIVSNIGANGYPPRS